MCLERLARAVKWPGPSKKRAAKPLVGQILAARQSAELGHGVGHDDDDHGARRSLVGPAGGQWHTQAGTSILRLQGLPP